MRSIIFANYGAKDTIRLGPTLDVEHSHVRCEERMRTPKQQPQHKQPQGQPVAPPLCIAAVITVNSSDVFELVERSTSGHVHVVARLHVSRISAAIMVQK